MVVVYYNFQKAMRPMRTIFNILTDGIKTITEHRFIHADSAKQVALSRTEFNSTLQRRYGLHLQ